MKRMLMGCLLLTQVFTLAIADSQSDQLANVQAIMARAHQIQQTQQVDQQQQANMQKAGAGFLEKMFNDSTGSAKQQMITQSSELSPPVASPAPVAVVAPDIQQRIETLSEAETAVQSQVGQLQQAVSMLNQNQAQLAAQNDAIQKQLTALPVKTVLTLPAGSGVKSVLKDKTTSYVLYTILLLLVIIILLMLIPKRSAYRIDTETDLNLVAVTEPGSEYDFMGTEDTIPAKLDLARAYIAMEDYWSAVRLLKEVKKVGNENQRFQAQKMLATIPK